MGHGPTRSVTRITLINAKGNLYHAAEVRPPCWLRVEGAGRTIAAQQGMSLLGMGVVIEVDAFPIATFPRPPTMPTQDYAVGCSNGKRLRDAPTQIVRRTRDLLLPRLLSRRVKEEEN